MVVCGYIFDIIIVRIDAPNTQFEDSSQLSVDAVFNNVPLKITSSRINVVEFRSGSSYEFNANPEELKTDMKKNPLKLTVIYKTDTVGSGQFEWPDTVLNRISECVGELTHMDECELKSEELKVGSVEIIIRLKTKCQEMEDEAGAATTGDDIRKQLNKVINPHDVLFVVGDTNKDDICAALLPQVSQLSNEAQHSTALDLSRYRSVNGRLVQTPDILNTCGNVECCELKKISNEYQKLIDTLMSCPGGNRSLPLERPSCRTSCNSKECRQDNKFSESGSSTRDSSEQKFPCTCFAAQHNSSSGAFEGEKLINICPRDSPPELKQTTYISNRKCPICKENLAWLPKLSACPKCGYKPVPYVEEKPYDTQMTADQILQEYLDKLSSSTDNKGDGKEKDACCDDKKECRCTCKNGKVCAHCRIRKLCEDIFQTKTANSGENAADECHKCETKSSQDVYNVCKSSSKDCRPYLARVFSELRELYNIKETKRKAFEVNQRCERALNKNDAEKKPHNQSKTVILAQHHQQEQQHQQAEDQHEKSVKHNQQEETVDRKMYLTKNFKKSNEACNPKIYNYNAVRKYPPKSLRHKMCVNGFAVGRRNVPHNMGWLWNVDTEGTRRGWKPGAIRRPIKCLMKYFLNDFPADTLRVSQYSYRKESKGECTEEEELVQKPTLHICKKNDEYFITLRPLKDAEALRHCADPYLNMKPIEFRITKNPLLNAMRNLKRNLKDMGFAKCTCHMPVVDCCCRNYLDKKRLEYQVNKECRKRCLPCCSQTLVLSDTTDSDVEFDFGVTPPAGVIKPERLKRPNLVNHGTQYEQGDWNVMPVFPKPPNKYMKQYNCATGDRYDTTGGGGRKKGDGGAGKGGGKAGGGAGRGGGKAGGGGRGGGAGAGGGGAGGKGGAGRKKGDGEKGGDRERGGTAGSAGPGGKSTRGEKGGPNSYFGDKNKGGSNEDKKKRLRKLAEMPPPLICMVDRRGKPADPCAFVCEDVCGYPRDICADVCCVPRGNNRIC